MSADYPLCTPRGPGPSHLTQGEALYGARREYLAARPDSVPMNIVALEINALEP